MQTTLDLFSFLWSTGTSLVAAAAFLAAVLPQTNSPGTPSWWPQFRRVLNLIGQNYNNAKNLPQFPNPQP